MFCPVCFPKSGGYRMIRAIPLTRMPPERPSRRRPSVPSATKGGAIARPRVGPVRITGPVTIGDPDPDRLRRGAHPCFAFARSPLLSSSPPCFPLRRSTPPWAEPGADLAAGISGNLRVRIGMEITYTITATNIGDATATGVQLSGWVPDWFDGGEIECTGGTPGEGVFTCDYPDLAPGGTVSMTLTTKAVAGNKVERRMYEIGSVYATNDVNLDNNEARIPVHMTGPCRNCPNK